ncbi:MAG: carbohydrate-binding family 9-like protein [Bacteroidia bacterium]|nr:carbohydrate-binding family 9-like protein [Bacteroidia bacterium]
MKNHFLLTSFLLLIVAMSVSSCDKEPSAEVSFPPNTYPVKKLTGSITLDGKGSDPAWQQAVVLDTFRFPWLEIPTPHTEFRALWNENYLFFQFVVVDEDVVIHEDTTQNRAVLGSDRVELFFSVNDSLNPYYSLEMDPRAWVFSSIGRFPRKIDPSWKWPGLVTMATLTTDGYILEGSIPMSSFTDLNLWRNEAKTRLNCGVFRAEFSHNDDGSVAQNWISWIIPDSPKPDFHIPSAFGWFELIQ